MDRIPKRKSNQHTKSIKKAEKERRERARQGAEAIFKKCCELADAGDIKRASRYLNEHILKEFVPGRPQGQVGATTLHRTAIHLLSQCVIRHVPPPERLLRAFELLLNIEPDNLGDHACRVAFAAQYPSMDDVPVSGLAQAHVMTHEYVFNTGEVAPKKTKLKEPIGTPRERSTARKLKADPEFQKQVREAKARGTPENRKKQEATNARAKRDADRFEKLLEVVERTARGAETAHTQQYREGTPGAQSEGAPGPNSTISIAANSGPKRKTLSERHTKLNTNK